MAMLDKGRMLMIADREEFERLRDFPVERIDELDEKQQLIRQFLRGDAEGPITRRKEATNYAEDLLGSRQPILGDTPAIQSTRKV
jgi:hypothetical protein